ncbi:MAG: hypothetical protein CMB13_03570 [Euryarchaeota archaeon]|nr:hypothetical protein [Euryarchaeota archaeon]
MPGAVLDVLILDIEANATNGSGDSLRRPPFLVELHTATWCLPCRAAEVEVAELEATWSNVAILRHHSSNLDTLSVKASNETKQDQGIHGYPSIVVEGRWILNGSSQSVDFDDLIANMTSSGLTRNTTPTDNWIDGWSYGNGVMDVDVRIGMDDVQVDVYLLMKGVNGGQLGILPDTVVAGETDVNVSQSSTVSLNLSGTSISMTDDPGRIVLVVRNPGPAILTPGSDIFVSGDYQSVPPNPSTGSFAMSNPFLFWLALVGGVAFMLPAFQHTVPTLFSKRQSKIDEEE